MQSRIVKRKAKKGMFLVLIGTLVVVGVVLVFFAIRTILPFVNSTGNSSKMIDPVVKSAETSDIKKILASKNIDATSVVEATNSAYITVQIKDGPKVYFSRSKDTEWQVTSLQLMLTRLTIDNKKPTTIDMRYARPIVKF